MLVEKVGLGAKQGKTKLAIEQVAENLLLGNQVVYMTNELSYCCVKERLFEEAPDANIMNLIVEVGSTIEEVLEKYSEDVVIVADIGKDISEVVCPNPLYVYYQTPLIK